MSISITAVDARYSLASAAPPGTLIGDDEVERDHVAAVVRSASDALVIEGPKAQVVARLRETLAAVEAVDMDDPLPADDID